MNKLYRQYRDQAAFYVVYIEEAHAADAWQTRANLEENILFTTHVNLEERAAVANTCVRDLGIEFPALVDDFQNATETAYTGWPDRLYVIDREGRIAHKGGPGPYGFKPAEVGATLKRLLPGSL